MEGLKIFPLERNTRMMEKNQIVSSRYGPTPNLNISSRNSLSLSTLSLPPPSHHRIDTSPTPSHLSLALPCLSPFFLFFFSSIKYFSPHPSISAFASTSPPFSFPIPFSLSLFSSLTLISLSLFTLPSTPDRRLRDSLGLSHSFFSLSNGWALSDGPRGFRGGSLKKEPTNKTISPETTKGSR